MVSIKDARYSPIFVGSLSKDATLEIGIDRPFPVFAQIRLD
jgi:hypothetical protein